MRDRQGWGIARFVAAAWLALVATSVEARVFRVADIQPDDYPTVQALRYMDVVLRDKTGGRHSLEIFHSRELGEERETLDQTRAGAIDIDRINIAPLTALYPAANALAVPFLFRSEEHLHRVLEGPIGEEILSGFETYGLIGLTFYDSGTRSIYNSVRAVRSPADMAGLRIRVQQSQPMIDLLRALGAEPVPLAYGQVLAALQTDLIDGAENNWPSYVSTGHYLRARYITETHHTMPPEVLVMSAKSWRELDAEDQRIFRAAARESSLFMRTRWQQWVTQTRAQAVASGVNLVTDFDRSAFERAARGVGERILGESEVRALGDRIRDAP